MKKAHYATALKARKIMKEMLENGRRRWDKRASVGIVYKDIRNFYFSSNQECHAGLARAEDSIAVVSGLQKGAIDCGGGRRSIKEGEASDLTYEEQRYYLDWLLNRSPYAKVFQSKSASNALKQEFIIANTDVPANLMGGGLVASRRLWEYTWVAKVMVALAKKGVNENLAFFIGSCSMVTDKGHIHFQHANEAHCSLDVSTMSFSALKNWVENKPTNLHSNYCDGGSYRGYSGMFHAGQGRGDAFNFLGTFSCKEKAGKKNINPFAKAAKKVEEKVWPFDQAIEEMVEFSKQLMEKIK